MGKRRTKEQIRRLRREADQDLARGLTVAGVCRQAGIRQNTDHRRKRLNDSSTVDEGRRVRKKEKRKKGKKRKRGRKRGEKGDISNSLQKKGEKKEKGDISNSLQKKGDISNSLQRELGMPSFLFFSKEN